MMALALAAMVYGFRLLIFQHAPSVFSTPEEDMSYAWYVPLFSLYVVWVERAKILAAARRGEPSYAGLFCMIPCLAVGFLGARGLQVRFEILSFALLLVTLPWALWGREMASRLLFPALFLFFCIPLATFLDVITVHLRLLASGTAYEILRGFGADVIRRGTMIAALDGSFEIDVAEPCSGLRSIFALMALTAGYAYFNQPTWLRRGLLFASSVPIAMLGNVARILSICLVANYASADFATGFYHDYSGYVVFIVAILLMLATGDAINRIAARISRCKAGRKPVVAAESAAAAETRRCAAIRAAPAFAAFALLVFTMIRQAETPPVVVAEAPDARLGEIAPYESEELEPSLAETTILPKDTTIRKRLYKAGDGEWFQATIVIGGKGKSSIHRPELCLPAQGNLMTDPHTLEIDGSQWRVLTVSSPSSRVSFAYTFFNQEGYKTASHVKRIFRDTWDRTVHNRIDRWVMVTVCASSEGDEAISAIIRKLLPQLPL